MSDDPTNGTEWAVERVVKVTDGDTLRLVRSRPFDLDGRHYTLTDSDADGEAIRLVWVNTPEKGHHPGWENARADLAAWVRTYAYDGNGDITAHVICYESGGWDRLMGDLLDANGNSASQWLMIEKGWPPYTGDKA